MKTSVLCLITFLWLAPTVFAETAPPDEKQQNADLKQLLTEVRKILPTGWRAEITPDVPTDLIVVDAHRFNTVNLLIWHEEKVLGRWPLINDRPKTDEEIELDYKLETPKFDLAVVKYVSPAEYDEAMDENIRRQIERLTFAHKYLSSIDGSQRTGSVDPLFFHPKTNAEKELVRQYTLLWTRTKLAELPTHYFRTLSFEAHDLLYPHLGLRLKDEKIQAEQDQIREAVLKIITAYPEKELPDRP